MRSSQQEGEINRVALMMPMSASPGGAKSTGAAVAESDDLHASADLHANAVADSAILSAIQRAQHDNAERLPAFYANAFEHAICWSEFAKIVAINSAGTAGGAVGCVAGAVAGATVGMALPLLGTAAGAVFGGIVGVLAGEAGTSIAAKAIADNLLSDESHLLDPLRDELEAMGMEFALTEDEIDDVVEVVKETVTMRWIRRMTKSAAYSDDPILAERQFVRDEFEPTFQEIVARRPLPALMR